MVVAKLARELCCPLETQILQAVKGRVEISVSRKEILPDLDSLEFLCHIAAGDTLFSSSRPVGVLQVLHVRCLLLLAFIAARFQLGPEALEGFMVIEDRPLGEIRFQ